MDKEFANIRDEVFDKMEIDFKEIMDQESSDEEVLSDDIGCASDMSEYEIDRVEKFVLSPEIRTLNAHTKPYVIHSYYTMGSALTVCTSCMIHMIDIDGGMYFVRKYKTGLSFCRLDGRSCTNCRESLYIIFSCSTCSLCTH